MVVRKESSRGCYQNSEAVCDPKHFQRKKIFTCNRIMKGFNHGITRIRKVVFPPKHILNMCKLEAWIQWEPKLSVLFSNSALSTKDIWVQSLSGSSSSDYFPISEMEKGSFAIQGFCISTCGMTEMPGLCGAGRALMLFLQQSLLLSSPV